ncbi:uncharacterized protein [Aristolochia californica]|uniref:uncharacterized protein n=1 Tax=Aristolochia californica TaxID=171875 RepID=UPI0035DC9A16
MLVSTARTFTSPSHLLLGLSRRPGIVSAKFHRRLKQPSVKEDTGGVGFAILTAVKSDSSKNSEPPRRLNDSNAVANNSTGDERSLSGSDILLALQKAAVQKSRKRSRGKPRGMAGVTDEGEDVSDYSNVRQLNIRNDWAARLDELERDLEELQKLEA